MPRVKVTEDEFDRLEAEARNESRHKELYSALRETMRREGSSAKLDTLLETLGKNPDLRPLLAEVSKEVKELRQIFSERGPKSFRVERDRNGLIERVVVE